MKVSGRTTTLCASLVACSLMASFAVPRECCAQKGFFTGYVSVSDPTSAAFQLVNSSNNYDNSWQMHLSENGNDLDFCQYFYTQNTNFTPFVIESQTPDYSLYLQNTTGFVGLGTNTPTAPLHIVQPYSIKSSSSILLDALGNGGKIGHQTWNISASPNFPAVGGFSISEVGAGGTPFVIEGNGPSSSLYIDTFGAVGSGTSTPSYQRGIKLNGLPLNVHNATGNAILLAQGVSSGELRLTHLGAATNTGNLRIMSCGGITYFDSMNDSDTSLKVANSIMTMNMSSGYVGLQVKSPTNPLQLASGAKCTSGGAWTNASSREYKQDIAPISSEQARETVKKLQPVGYRYKSEPDEPYVGFIAEDVPDLVATNDRKSLGSMDIVAVLTKVVQDQDNAIADQQKTIAEERRRNDRLEAMLDTMNKRLAELEAKSR